MLAKILPIFGHIATSFGAFGIASSVSLTMASTSQPVKVTNVVPQSQAHLGLDSMESLLDSEWVLKNGVLSQGDETETKKFSLHPNQDPEGLVRVTQQVSSAG